MSRTVFRRLCCASVLPVVALGVWLLVPSTGQSFPEHKMPHPVLDVPGLMKTFNQPLYTRLHELMQRGLNDEQAWNQVQYEGLRAAEVANLIVLRHVPEKIVPTVIQHASELQDAGIALATAGRAHNPQQTTEAYHRLLHSCNACHTALAPGKLPELTP